MRAISILNFPIISIIRKIHNYRNSLLLSFLTLTKHLSFDNNEYTNYFLKIENNKFMPYLYTDDNKVDKNMNSRRQQLIIRSFPNS